VITPSFLREDACTQLNAGYDASAIGRLMLRYRQRHQPNVNANASASGSRKLDLELPISDGHWLPHQVHLYGDDLKIFAAICHAGEMPAVKLNPLPESVPYFTCDFTNLMLVKKVRREFHSFV
jgi:hypothetical protein